MEEKKLDLNSIIGFVLIFGILIWIMYQNQPSQKEIDAKKAQHEQAIQAEKVKKIETKQIVAASSDTTVANTAQLAALKMTLGNFAYSATLPSAKETFTTIENELVRLTVANKGGYIVEAKLKNFEKFHFVKNFTDVLAQVHESLSEQ
jgi:YidC/Oxa1 family membrane protein insertase